MPTTAELEVGDLIAVHRIKTVPCCYCETTGCCELVGRRARTGVVIETVLCTTRWRTFRRFWISDA